MTWRKWNWRRFSTIFSRRGQLGKTMAIDSQTYQKQQPRDARIIALILQSLGVEDYDPKVVHQLLEFAHRKFTHTHITPIRLTQGNVTRLYNGCVSGCTGIWRTREQGRSRSGRHSTCYSRSCESFIHYPTAKRSMYKPFP